jgi:hypothetical protein
MYKSNLRPVVAFIATIAAIWAISSSIGDFRNFGVDRTHNVPKLALFSLVLGAIYMGVFVIELFGLLSAFSNKTPLVRVYAYLTLVSALAVIAAGLLEIVIHFTLKNEIINICSDLTDGQEIVYYGFFGPTYHTVLNEDQAVQFCTSSWNHDSWTVIITLLLTGFLGIMFSSIAFAYLHQLMDPASPANSARAFQGRVQGNPSYYNPPYNTTYNGPYDGQSHNDYYAARAPAYVPSAPPPPMPERDDPFVPPDDTKPPSYSGSGLGFGAGDHKDDDDPFSMPERDVTSSTRDRF